MEIKYININQYINEETGEIIKNIKKENYAISEDSKITESIIKNNIKYVYIKRCYTCKRRNQGRQITLW